MSAPGSRTIQLTARLRLAVPPDVAFRLRSTQSRYAAAFDAVVDAGWSDRRINGVELHKRTYRALRNRLDLPSQLVISARMKAVEALKACRTLASNGKKVSKPSMQSPSIRFDARSYRLDWDKGVAHLTIMGGRVAVPVLFDKHSETFRGLETASADLLFRNGSWHLHVVVNKEAPTVAETGLVVGVDRGVNRPAVTSEFGFFGKRSWRDHEHKLLSLRRRLQAKGTKSARRHLRRLGTHLARFRRDCDHCLSKALVLSCEPGDRLVFEDLTDIRGRVKARGRVNRRRLHAWSFKRLGGYVEYKAAIRGVFVDYVDPRDSSRRCPMCGYIDKGNRRDQAHFRCLRCGFTRNADLVASWNIRDRRKGLWSPVSIVPARVNGPNAVA